MGLLKMKVKKKKDETRAINGKSISQATAAAVVGRVRGTELGR